MGKENVVASVRGVAAGVIVAAILLILRNLGVVEGPLSLILGALLIIALPVSESLSRRILLTGSIAVGWLPVAWWLDLGPFDDRSGWILALGWGALAGWVVAGNSVTRLRMLVPRWRIVDLLPLLTAVIGLWLYAPFLRSPSAGQTLTLLMKSGWDHVSHSAMYELFATGGSLVSTYAQTPDGSSLAFKGYPTGFHMFAGAVGSLISGPVDPGGIHSYAIATSLVLVLMATMVAAAIAQLPSMIERPAIAVPLIALPVAALYFGPGNLAVAAGFPNFVFACAAVGVSAAIAVVTPRVLAPLQLFAILGLVVATAHSWLLLVPLTAVSAVAVLFPWKRSRWRASPIRTALSIAAAVAGLVGVAVAAIVALPSLNSSTLLAGGSDSYAAGTTFAACMVTLGLGALAAWRWWGRRSKVEFLRSAIVALIPALALAMMLVIGYQQIRQTGSLLYYFEKLATGTLLATLIVLAVVAAPLLSRRTGARLVKGARALPWIGATAVAVGAIQVFGYIGPSFGGAVKEEAAGVKYRQDSVILTAGRSAEATRLENAVRIAGEQPFGSTIYLAALPGDQPPQLANLWHLSLAGTWTKKSEEAGKPLGSGPVAQAIADGDLALAIEDLVRDEPGRSVIVAPEILDEVSGKLSADDRSRLLSW